MVEKTEKENPSSVSANGGDNVCIKLLLRNPSTQVSNDVDLFPITNALNGLTEVVGQQKSELKSIASPNQTDWISVGIDLSIAVLAAYAALKVHDILKEKGDEKVHIELTSFWEVTDEMLSDFRMYEWLFPFKLLEPVDEWENNEAVKDKVSRFLNFSESQAGKLKQYYKDIHNFERNVNRYGWCIHKKAEEDFLELYKTTEYLFNGFGEYNCLTAKLFRIEKQFISPSMFFEFESFEWSERYDAINKNLARHIASIKELIEKMQNNVANLEDLASKRKFVRRK